MRENRTKQRPDRSFMIATTAACAALALLAGCSSSAPAASLDSSSLSPSGPESSALSPQLVSSGVGAGCVTAQEQQHAVSFDSANGAHLQGVNFGDGPVGIVLAHQSNGNLCQWVPYARTLATKGYRVLAFDFDNYGASGADPKNQPHRLDLDVVGAATELRAEGASTIVLVGASMGGGASVVAATEIEPTVAAVVDLSGSDVFPGYDAVAAAAKLTVPAFFAAGRSDPESVGLRKVYDADTFADKHLEMADGDAHGVLLLDPLYNPQAAQMRDLVETFIHGKAAG